MLAAVARMAERSRQTFSSTGGSRRKSRRVEVVSAAPLARGVATDLHVEGFTCCHLHDVIVLQQYRCPTRSPFIMRLQTLALVAFVYFRGRRDRAQVFRVSRRGNKEALSASSATRSSGPSGFARATVIILALGKPFLCCFGRNSSTATT